MLYLPWEEYAFYFAQGILICLLVTVLSRYLRPKTGRERSVKPWAYLSYELWWALPVIAVQWLAAGRELWRWRRLLVVSVAARDRLFGGV